MSATGKLVDMTASDSDVSPATSPNAGLPAQARVALALGLHGAVGEELLAQLVADARYSWVHVGLRHSIGSATPKYRPWVIGHSTILADDGYLCLSDDRTPPTASPIARFRATDVSRAIDITRAAGVRRLMIIATKASAPDKQTLGAMDFGTLVIVQPEVPVTRADRGWMARAFDAMGRVSRAESSRTPMPPVHATARSVIAAFDHFGPGLHRVTLRELAVCAAGARSAQRRAAHS